MAPRKLLNMPVVPSIIWGWFGVERFSTCQHLVRRIDTIIYIARCFHIPVTRLRDGCFLSLQQDMLCSGYSYGSRINRARGHAELSMFDTIVAATVFR